MTSVLQISFSVSEAQVEITQMNALLREVTSVGGDGVDEFSKAWKTGAHRCGLRINTENLPTQMQVKGRKRTLPDFFIVAMGQVVSPKLKALIEQLDPDVHQFEPVTLTWKDRSVAGEWFWFIPARRLKSLKEDQLNPPLHPTGTWYPIDPVTKEHVDHDKLRIVFDKTKIGDAVIWCDPALVGRIFVSEDFRAAVNAEGIQKMEFIEFEMA